MFEDTETELAAMEPALFMDDSEAIAIREDIDFSKRITFEEAMNDTGRDFIWNQYY